MILHINRRKNNKIIKSESYKLEYIGLGKTNFNFNLSQEDSLFILNENIYPLTKKMLYSNLDIDNISYVLNNFDMKVTYLASISTI